MPARMRFSVMCTLALAACTGDVTHGAADAGASGPTHDAATSDAQVQTDAHSAGSAGSSAAGGGGSAAAGSGGTAGAESAAAKVSIFVAQGHKGRLMISCDDGHTWIADHDDDSTVHCFDTPQHDCDHDPGAGRGLAHGNGYFVATFGWGEPGYIARSKNGVDWEKLTQTNVFADLAFGNGKFIANANDAQVSTDGATWMQGGMIALNVQNVRAIGFTPKNGGRFVVTGESDANHDLVISKDGGQSWVHPSTLPAECGANVTGLASSPDIILVAQGGGRVCSSNDGGDTWTTTVAGAGFTSPPVWTGGEFMVWQNENVYRSADATAWTMQAITPSSAHIGVVAVNDKGTFVATKADWNSWYDQQEFYRSEDGVSWEVLPKTAFHGGHPIFFMEAGEVDASAACATP